MQTRFTPAQLRDPAIAAADEILRKCVHCGFCTATCPTYVLRGDELDSPRGRIYLIKEMLENERPATADIVPHFDRCLSCLACMTTCPSGVHYQHLIDHARAHVERTFRRPWPDRLARALLALVLPHPRRFRWMVRSASLARPFARLLPARLRAMVDAAQRHLPSGHVAYSGTFAAQGRRRARVGLLTGCVQSVLAPHVNAATVRVLARAGVEVVLLDGCCGAIVHHLGREAQAGGLAARLIRTVTEERRKGGLDAVVMNASGCGTHVKDYGYLFRTDPLLGADAASVSALAKDVTELLHELGLPTVHTPGNRVIAYHSPCSMQHGQKLDSIPRSLLLRAGYTVREIPEGHLCCGSAGTYSLLQPQLSGELRDRKLAHIARTGAQAVATGNIGCLVQLTSPQSVPVFHTIELLDAATCPDA